MNKKIIFVTMLILLIILAVLLIVLKNNIRTPKENLSYINSDEMEEGTFSPDKIHVIIAAYVYEGELNPKAISKSTYYFINSIIPEFLKQCTDDEKTDKYFEKNSENIKINIGITEKEEFEALINEIRKLSGKLEYENSWFDLDSINRTRHNLETILHIKYKDNPEITVKLTISNKQYRNKTSIKYEK